MGNSFCKTSLTDLKQYQIMSRLIIIAIIFGFTAYVAFRAYKTLWNVPTLPNYDQDKYWGPGGTYEKDISVLKVLISFDDDVCLLF